MDSGKSQKLLDDLAFDRGVYPHQFNLIRDEILLVRVLETMLDEASFLDERMLPAGTDGAWFPYEAVREQAQGITTKPLHYIFHMGHCGSTLLSRLVGVATKAKALREPLPFRSFAFDAAEGGGAFFAESDLHTRIACFEELWSRGDAPVVVKATSICTGLATAVSKDAQKIFIYQKPETHLAVLLAGANAANDLRGFAQMRHRRLAGDFSLPPLSSLSLGGLAALSWLSEAASIARAKTKKTAVRFFSFDAFLSDPAASLAAICEALQLHADAAQIEAAVGGPVMKAYSKAPDHGYDAALRMQIIAESGSRHAGEIRKGMDFLEQAERENPELSTAFELFS